MNTHDEGGFVNEPNFTGTPQSREVLMAAHPGIEITAQWADTFYMLVQGNGTVRLLFGETISGQTRYNNAIVVPIGVMKQIAAKFTQIVDEAERKAQV